MAGYDAGASALPVALALAGQVHSVRLFATDAERSGMDDAPAGWEVWSAGDDGRVVLAYRPDVFDGDAFPAACMPTLYLTRGRRNARRPGAERDTALDWFVTLFLEPEVTVAERRFDDREGALDGLRTIAADFADGAIDYRDSYQVPRETYLDELDALTGRDA